MREVLGAGRGVQAGEVEIPAMAAEAGRETRQGAESDEESGRRLQGLIIRPPHLAPTHHPIRFFNSHLRIRRRARNTGAQAGQRRNGASHES
jgi:hypothetical protein